MKTIIFRKGRISHLGSFLCLVVSANCLLASFPHASRATEPESSAAILHDLKSFSTMGSVLMIAAHPDDENTQLITYLSRGRGYRMAYLSLTRGDGGQNLLGPEFGAELGLIRTQELLAARRIDGGQQFFTRALDFGFSKDYKETLSVWDHQQVLSDIVRVIRTFRPDVIVTRFSTIPGNTHGHHTASAVLAVEAYKLCGDPKAFPEQLIGDITPCQPRRILYNGFTAGMAPSNQLVPGAANTTSAIRIDISGNDSVSGETFAAIAQRSRSQHKTQGFGNIGTGGGGRGGAGAARPETFQLLDGEPATKDIMDGIDTTWARVNGGGELVRMIEDAIAKFDPKDPSASVPALLAIRAKLAKLPADAVVDDRRQQFDRILQACLGLSVQTTIPQAEVVPDETLKMTHTATVTSNIPVRWVDVRYPTTVISSIGVVSAPIQTDLHAMQTETREVSRTMLAVTMLSQPYWLREQGTAGMFRVRDPSLIGRPENPPAFPIEQVFEVGGQTLVIPDEPVQVTVDPVKGETRRRLEIIPPVRLNFASDIQLFAPGTTKDVDVEVTSFRTNTAGTLELDSPADWKISPSYQSFDLKTVGQHAGFRFSVTAPAQLGSNGITARAVVNGVSYDNDRVEIKYDHIPPLLLQPPARFNAVNLNLAIRGKNIGYIAGAGDSIADCLMQMGYTVTTLNGADLTPDKLQELDAVVIGIRAFNVRDDLAPHMQALFDFVAAGGNVIEQYNRPDGLKSDQFAPYSLHLSSLRVTDENAVVTFLAPDHPVLNTPNKITAADFNGWVQERSIYLPDQWANEFTPILGAADANETPPNSALLIAHHGKGYFVYTSLVFFRQLPAGNPGAYRLFANMVSLGK